MTTTDYGDHGTWIDFDPATAEPEELEQLELVYDRADGSRAVYETNTLQAWSHSWDPYTMLGAAFETYDDAGSVFFRRPQP